ncbi:hypothetical protein DV738_g3394, partial [Chaetothyriales sp. CBS 135597]
MARRLSRFSFSKTESAAMQDTGWADGLRGIAAVGVVASHLVICYARAIIPPCCGENEDRPLLFQLPILRLVAAGHSWVAIFFILMGFVNALKPLQLVRSGQAESALDKLAKSSFSRILRLMLPATLATLISWLFCQLGFYETARKSDAYWLRMNTPAPSSSVAWALHDLVTALKQTWMFSYINIYDQPQWALIYLLQGSFMVIGALLLTARMSPRWRTGALILLTLWTLDLSRAVSDPFTGPASIAGILLAELSLTFYPQRLSSLSKFLTAPLCLFSLFLMSYTDIAWDQASWTTVLFKFASRYLPMDNIGGYERTYGTIGAIVLIFSIVNSPTMRWLLSRKPLRFLGRISFAIYLLHGIVLRSVFAWVLFFGTNKTEFVATESDEISHEHRYPVPGIVHCGVATVIAGIIILAASHIWNAIVEPWFGQITSVAEDVVTGRVALKSLFVCGTTAEDEKDLVLPIRED